MVDDDLAPSPEEMLKLIEQQQSAALKRFLPDPLLLYVPWGVAWILGFGAYFLIYGFDGTGYVSLPWEFALAVSTGGQLIALALLIYAVHRAGAHIRGQSGQRGAMYGTAWFVGMCSVGMIGSHFAPQLAKAETGLLFSAFSMLVVGVLYMAGGALYGVWPQFFLGVWTSVINIVGAALGVGWHPLLMATLVGGGTVATGVWMRWRR